MGEFGIGQAVARTEDPHLLKGGGRFVDDNIFAGQAYGYVLRSPHAHAKIKAIDLAAVGSAPGVLAVLTLDDYAADGHGRMPFAPPPSVGWDHDAAFDPVRKPLAGDRVRHVGDPIAFIVAESLDAAKDAAELAVVDYEMLAPAIGSENALAPGAALVWDDCPNNVCFVYETGDEQAAGEAFAKAAHVVSQRLVINRVSANSMEARGCVCDYDPKRDFHTVYLGTQSAFGTRRQLAAIFGAPEIKFRIVTGDMGGSFGMKGALYSETVLTVWASRRLGRPVRWISDRSEAFVSDNHGRDNITDAELALDAEGNFLALRVKTIADLGAHLSTLAAGPPTIHLSGLIGVYKTAAAHVHVTGVFTNTNPTAAYRGAGRPEASYVIERLVDLAAAEIGMDRAEIRRRNMIPPDALPYQTPLSFNYDSGEFARNLDDALARGDYAGFEARRAAAAKSGKLRGIGVAYAIERAAPPGMEHAEIRFDGSGTATLFAGTTNHGQGHQTMYTQLVCDMLGLVAGDVRVVEGDTGKVQFGFGTGGSRVSAMGTGAAYLAANKIIAKGKKIAAHVLEAAENDLMFVDGAFTIAGTDKSLSLKDVAKMAFVPAKLPPGIEPGFAASGTYRAALPNYPNGCHVCEVEVDEETGALALLAYVVVDDVGTVINPLLLDGQIHGGVAQGLGQILMEDIAYDRETGQLLSGSFLDYCMPRSDDICAIEVANNPAPTETNPLGVKGAGEAGTIGALPAVMNAVVDALSPLGITHLDMPVTAPRLWAAIRDAKAS